MPVLTALDKDLADGGAATCVLNGGHDADQVRDQKRTSLRGARRKIRRGSGGMRKAPTLGAGAFDVTISLS